VLKTYHSSDDSLSTTITLLGCDEIGLAISFEQLAPTLTPSVEFASVVAASSLLLYMDKKFD
jgi:hypothetical protein